MRSKILLVLIVLSFSSCHQALREEAKRPTEALVPVRFFFPAFEDDSAFPSLEDALKRNLGYLRKIPSGRSFEYGRNTYTVQDVVESQEVFLSLISEGLGQQEFKRRLKKDFNLYRASGRAGNKKVLFTGYFEPVFEARLTPDETFRHPIYQKPDDLVKIDLSLLARNSKARALSPGLREVGSSPIIQDDKSPVEKALEGRNLEIAWLKDPVDVAFLQIQGSGRLELGEGKAMSVGYAEKNGHPYRALGRYLVDKGFLTMEEVSMQSIGRVFRIILRLSTRC
jgi:membrane-bound lytic murein transglycosylase A